MRTLEEIVFAEDRLVQLILSISEKQRQEMASEELAANRKDYVAAERHHQVLMGLMTAETLVRDDLRGLERIRSTVLFMSKVQ